MISTHMLAYHHMNCKSRVCADGRQTTTRANEQIRNQGKSWNTDKTVLNQADDTVSYDRVYSDIVNKLDSVTDENTKVLYTDQQHSSCCMHWAMPRGLYIGQCIDCTSQVTRFRCWLEKVMMAADRFVSQISHWVKKTTRKLQCLCYPKQLQI